MFVLVAYDIAHPRRLKQTAGVLERYGARVRKSVFECELSPRQIDALLSELKSVVNRRTDKVRIYRLCRTCEEKTDVGGRDFAPSKVGVWLI